MVGIPALAKNLVNIQATIISKNLPNIVRQINEKLTENVAELSKMPQHLSTVPEAMAVFMQVMGSAKESLKKILIRGEYDEYPNEDAMHATARLADMLNSTSDELQSAGSPETPEDADFLMEEVRVLEESKGIGLPNFLPRSGFIIILQGKINNISEIPVEFMSEAWTYIQTVVVSVLMHHFDNYPALQFTARRAVNNLISKKKEHSTNHIEEIVEMEKNADYTCNPEYMLVWNQIMSVQQTFISVVQDASKSSVMNIQELGKVDVAHMRKYKPVAQQAFDLRKRERLNKSIKLLKESNDVVSIIMYKIAVYE